MAKFRAIWREQLRHNLRVYFFFINLEFFFNNQLLERHPFSGRCDSAGELLHTPYADSNFHGHRPAFGTTRNTLSVYRKVGADNVRPGLSWERQVESLIASSAYQKWPTTNLRYDIGILWYLRANTKIFEVLMSVIFQVRYIIAQI